MSLHRAKSLSAHAAVMSAKVTSTTEAPVSASHHMTAALAVTVSPEFTACLTRRELKPDENIASVTCFPGHPADECGRR